MHREKTSGNNKLCMTPGTLDTFEAPHAPRPKGQVTTRPRARKIPSIIRLGQRISKADMPAGALLFPSDRARHPRERENPLSVAPLADADAPMGSLLSDAAQRSISVQVNTRLCGDRVGRSERGRGVHAKPAATGRRADPILCGARPGGDRALAVWLRRPPRGGPACSGERDHVSQGSRPR